MVKKLLFYFLALSCSVSGQENQSFTKGALQMSAGTVHVYRVLSIGYESPSLIQLWPKHSFRLSVNAGLWNARLYTSNTGSQINANVIYLFGEKAHKLELDFGITSHFDKGLKGQNFNYIASIPNYYVGYRFEPLERKIYCKFGIGWYQALQIGFGYRFH